METEEEKGFEVVDKRVGREETQAEETPEEPVSGTEEQEAEEELEGAAGDVYSLIQWTVLMLSESAWQWLGLHMNPISKKVEKDLAQAKVAIDSVVYLTDQIASHVSEEQRRAYRALVNDLRVNFVQQSQSG